MDSPKAKSQPQDELQELLDSLPTEIGPAKETLYLYKGFWCTPISLKGLMACRQQFQARASDMVIVTAPKTGTTWLKSLVFAITRRNQHPISNPDHPLLTNNPHDLVPIVNYENMLPAIANTTSPRLLSAHVAYSQLPESIKNSKCRFIYMCRNPKDMFVSTWYFAKTTKGSKPAPLEDFFSQFCKGVSWFGPYWDHALEFWKLSLERPEEVLFLRYEDLKGDITCQLKKLAKHLGCPFSLKEENEGVIDEIVKLCSFDHLRNLEVNKTGAIFIPIQLDNCNFFRKGGVGDWKNELTPEMAKQLDQLFEEKLRGSGLKFD